MYFVSTHTLYFCTLKARSHRPKANAKAKIFFDVLMFFFDLFQLSIVLDLFRFQIRFRPSRTGLKSSLKLQEQRHFYCTHT